MAVRADELDELIARAYEAGADPALWPRFLEHMALVFGEENCTLQVHDVRHQHGSISYSFGIDREVERAYGEYYGALNPWTLGAGEMMVPGRALAGEMVLPVRELKRTEFYADFLRKTDVLHSICAVIARDRDIAAFVSLQRPAAHGEGTTEELAALERLAPHLRRALEIHRRLGALRDRNAALEESVDRVPWGIVVLDAQRRVVIQNLAARAIDRRTMERILAVANAGGGVVAREARRPLSVSVAPLRVEDPVLGCSAALHVVFIVDPDARRASPLAWLRATYGLTATEARLALALAQGELLDEIAEATGSRLATVRTHLRRVFAKTGTRRQSELVRLVLLGAPAWE